MVTHACVLSCLSLVVLMMLSPVVLGMSWHDLGLGMGQHELSGMVPPLSPPVEMAYCTVRAHLRRKVSSNMAELPLKRPRQHGWRTSMACQMQVRPLPDRRKLNSYNSTTPSSPVCPTTNRLQNGDNSTVLRNDSTFLFTAEDPGTNTIGTTGTSLIKTLLNAVLHALFVPDIVPDIVNNAPCLRVKWVFKSKASSEAYKNDTMPSAAVNELLHDALPLDANLLNARNCRPNPSESKLPYMEDEPFTIALPLDYTLLNARNCRPNLTVEDPPVPHLVPVPTCEQCNPNPNQTSTLDGFKARNCRPNPAEVTEAALPSRGAALLAYLACLLSVLLLCVIIATKVLLCPELVNVDKEERRDIAYWVAKSSRLVAEYAARDAAFDLVLADIRDLYADDCDDSSDYENSDYEDDDWVLPSDSNTVFNDYAFMVYSDDDGDDSSLVDFAFMLSGDGDSADYDSRKYNQCAPYQGRKGVKWRTFDTDFGNAMMAHDDEDASFEETMRGTDIGGDVYVAMLNPAGLAMYAPVTGVQTRRRVKRLRKLFSMLYKHIDEPRLREMISDQCGHDGRAAFVLLDQHCSLAITDLESVAIDAEWERASIPFSIGVTLESITLFVRLINGLNSRRPAGMKKSQDDLCKKLLLSITYNLNPTLAHEAALELRATAANRKFHDAVTGERDFSTAATHFDELWRSLFEQNAIRPANRRAPGGRIESVAVTDEAYYYDGGGDPEEYDSVYAASDGGRRQITMAELKKETACWNCRGFGHDSPRCPSAKGHRPPEAILELLKGIVAGRSRDPVKGKGKPKGKGKGKPAATGKGKPGGRGRAATSLGRGARTSAALHLYDEYGAYVATSYAPGPDSYEEPYEEEELAPEDEGEEDANYAVEFENGDEWDEDDAAVAIDATDSDTDGVSSVGVPECDEVDVLSDTALLAWAANDIDAVNALEAEAVCRRADEAELLAEDGCSTLAEAWDCEPERMRELMLDQFKAFAQLNDGVSVDTPAGVLARLHAQPTEDAEMRWDLNFIVNVSDARATMQSPLRVSDDAAELDSVGSGAEARYWNDMQSVSTADPGTPTPPSTPRVVSEAAMAAMLAETPPPSRPVSPTEAACEYLRYQAELIDEQDDADNDSYDANDYDSHGYRKEPANDFCNGCISDASTIHRSIETEYMESNYPMDEEIDWALGAGSGSGSEQESAPADADDVDMPADADDVDMPYPYVDSDDSASDEYGPGVAECTWAIKDDEWYAFLAERVVSDAVAAAFEFNAQADLAVDPSPAGAWDDYLWEPYLPHPGMIIDLYVSSGEEGDDEDENGVIAPGYVPPAHAFEPAEPPAAVAPPVVPPAVDAPPAQPAQEHPPFMVIDLATSSEDEGPDPNAVAPAASEDTGSVYFKTAPNGAWRWDAEPYDVANLDTPDLAARADEAAKALTEPWTPPSSTTPLDVASLGEPDLAADAAKATKELKVRRTTPGAVLWSAPCAASKGLKLLSAFVGVALLACWALMPAALPLSMPPAALVAAAVSSPTYHADLGGEVDWALPANADGWLGGTDSMIVDCGATKHCTPDIDSLSRITERSPTRTVRVGNGKSLSVSAVGEMQKQVETSTPVLRKKKRSVRHSVETMLLTNVLVVPDMKCQLFSCAAAYQDEGIRTYLNASRYLVLPSGGRVGFNGSKKHYAVNFVDADEYVAGCEYDGEYAWATHAARGDDAELLHERPGHFSMARINSALVNNNTTAFSQINHDTTNCEACMLNRNKKPRPRASSTKSEYKYFGERVSSDTCGPFPESPGGFTYCVCFYDHYTKHAALYFLRTHGAGEILGALQAFLLDHKAYLGSTKVPGTVDTWHSDNGTEFLDHNIDTFCQEIGTRRAMSPPYTPTRNASAERLWGTLLRPTAKMIAHAGKDDVKLSLWPYAMSQAVRIHNALPTRGHSPPTAPAQRLEPDVVPDLSVFKVMFCDCYCSIEDKEIPTKVSSVRVKAVHLGYDPIRRCYIVYIPEINRVTQTLDCDFTERSFSALGPDSKTISIKARDISTAIADPADAERAAMQRLVASTGRAVRAQAARDAKAAAAATAAATAARGQAARAQRAGTRATARDVRNAPVPLPVAPPPRRPAPPTARVVAPRRAGLLMRHDAADADGDGDLFVAELAASMDDTMADEFNFEYFDSALLASSLGDGCTAYRASKNMGESLYNAEDVTSPIPVPRNAREAINDPIYGPKWLLSMQAEVLGKYTVNKAWKYVKSIPKGRKIMKGKWTFAVKYKDDGSLDRLKSRWVACGYSQIEGVDYNEVYASTLPITPCRLFFAAACLNDWEIEEIDTVLAFSQAEFEQGEQLYVEQPHFCKVADPTVVACLLRTPLEGCKQASYLYQKAVRLHLTEKMGYTQSMSEPNIYWKTVDGSTLRVAIYVDNMLLGFEKTDAGSRLATAFKADFAKRFRVDLRGPPTRFLGMEVTRTATTLSLTQTSFITKAFAKFLPAAARLFTSPVASSKLKEFTEIGLAKTDIERASMLKKPYLPLMGTLLWATLTHPEASYYVSYLCQFMHDPSTEAYDAGLNVLAYLMHAKDLGITYSSTSKTLTAYSDASWNQVPIPFGGHVVLYGGAAVSFSARKVRIVPQSSAESETAAYAKCCKDVRYVTNVLGADGFQLKISLPVTIHCDNTAAVSSIKNSGSTSRNRHYERWLQLGREQFLNLVSCPLWVRTADMVADIFTKPLDYANFTRLRAILLNYGRGYHN